ncbi:hypothetical protein KF913_00055 [Candidatus Obscuribacterales bacterium]|nr:hypothetical protein [Candidatus Obscuribacterales bacterium]
MAEIAREAIRWYLEYRTQGKESKIESELSRNIKNMTDLNMRHARTPGRADRDTGIELAPAYPCRKQNARTIHRCYNLVKGKMRKRLRTTKSTANG